MALIFVWLLRLTTALLALAVGAVVLVWYFAARSLPDYSATLEVTGLEARVEIVRDNSNVPHIFGATDTDVFYALGLAHAQDRLWQMIMFRRVAQGRLSELFGPRTLKTDELMRRLDLAGAARASVAVQDEETMAALKAYADGVNAWLAEVNAGARGRGAPEMWLFNHAVAPWDPADSIAVLKLMALQMQTQLGTEVLRARASLLLGPEQLSDLMPEAPGPGVAALPRYGALMPELTRYAGLTGTRPDMSPLPLPALAGASNAWAAGSSRSATEATLLASDPHMALTAPSQIYLARLELTSGGVIGATIPGLPFVISGRSADVGWGLTSAYLDDLDVYVEEVNSADATQYLTPDGWADFRAEDSIIAVRDDQPVTVRLRWTENGPVLPFDLLADHLGLSTREILPAGHTFSVAWTALSETDTSASAAYRLMRATTLRGALDATEDYIAPAMMLTVADRNRIALRLIGAIPARDPAHASQGRLPTLGYEPQNRWQGRFPNDENPEWINPPGGLVGHTNNKILDAPFPRNISFDWGDTQRVIRWRRLMQNREVHTRESFMEAQLDTVSFTARSLLPLIGADLWFTGEAAADGTVERQRQVALRLLSEWNGEMNEHLPEPLLYSAWIRFLQERLIRDDIGPLADAFTHVEPLFLERVFRDVDGAARWCDVLQSAPIETCTDIARLALDDAIVWVSETYGRDLQTLRWGDAHEAVHKHPVLGDAPVLKWFVNIRQSTSGGDNTLQRGLTAGTGAFPFQNVHAAAYRGVYDFADPDSSVFINSTGQSGHFLSRYYDDLGELWRRGEYIPMSLDSALARGGAVGVTTLVPK